MLVSVLMTGAPRPAIDFESYPADMTAEHLWTLSLAIATFLILIYASHQLRRPCFAPC
jgi:hypothetical protein